MDFPDMQCDNNLSLKNCFQHTKSDVQKTTTTTFCDKTQHISLTAHCVLIVPCPCTYEVL